MKSRFTHLLISVLAFDIALLALTAIGDGNHHDGPHHTIGDIVRFGFLAGVIALAALAIATLLRSTHADRTDSG